MTALTLAQIKPAGTIEIATCELCHTQFDFTHNGEWLPANCPDCTEASKARRDSLIAIYEQIERVSWLNYFINLWQLPQLDKDFCAQTCLRYCPDFTPETARVIFNRENKKLADLQEADRVSRMRNQ